MSGSENAEAAAATLEILLGTSWKIDARSLARLHTYEKGEDRFDFTPIVDIIDIVVEGTNITSRLPEESIFCVMHELLGGLCSLLEGRLDKHIVAFAEAGWELAVQRADDDFAISFYRTGGPRDVSIHNVRVARYRLLNAACASTERLIDDLVDLNPAFRQDGLVRSLEQQLQLLHKQRDHRPPMRGVEIPAEIDEVALSLGSRALGLELCFDAAHEDFWRYEGALVSDLHSLLFSGSMRLSYWGRRRLVGESTYLFPLVEALAAGAERFLAALERGQGGCVLLDGTRGAESMLTVDVLDSDRVLLRITEPSGSVGRTRTTPEALFGLVVETVQRFLEIIVELNPRQVLNRRINDLRSHLDQLQGQFHDVRRGDLYFDGVQNYLRESPTVRGGLAEEAPESRMRYPLAELRHVFLKPAWYMTRQRLDFASLTPVGRCLLVASEGRVECLDRASGETAWSAECDVHLGPADDWVLLRRDGLLVAAELATGRLAWQGPATSSSSPPQFMRLGDEATASVALNDTTIALLQLEDGATRWRFELDHGDVVGSVVAGPVLAVLADDGFAYGLSPASGQVLWKVRVPGTCLLPPSYHQGRLYVCADSDVGIEGVLYSINPLTGRRVFERRSPATFSQPPVFVDRYGLFTLETPAQAAITAFDLETGRVAWSLGVDNARVDTPVMLHVEAEAGGLVVVKTDTGQCLGVEPTDGSVRWRLPLLDPGDILLSNLRPALIDGHVVVAERFVSIIDPQSGLRRHRFTDLPEHPHYLHVDDDLRLIVGEGDDHLECFDLSGFLALV